MKLPAIVDQLIHKNPPVAPRFLSLLLDELYVQTAVWVVGDRGRPTIVATNTQRIQADNWEARIEAGDRSFSALDEDGSVGDLHNVVLGLSSLYLTPTGDIDPSVRPEVKHLCKELDLKAIGFVSLPQALMNKLKNDEGVPPTVILLSVSDGNVTVSLYKIGMLAGQATIKTEEIVGELEATLKSWKDIEVLPSRMLLYGTDEEKLEELRTILLKHPWPTRVSFLHFPKIDVLPKEFGIEAVNLAGSAEMAIGMGEEEEVQSENDEEVIEKTKKYQGIVEVKEEDMFEAEPVAGGEPVTDEESNIVMVEPESLGFARGRDVLEEVESPLRKGSGQAKLKVESEEVKEMPKRKISLPKLSIPSISFDRVSGVFSLIRLPILGLPIVGLLLIVLLFFGLYLWFVPHASVTVLTLPKVLEKTTALIVNPTATIADAATQTIPGKNQEKVVSGEKTMVVAGKKDVGDPAKGKITIYNKTLSSKIFKKGTIITAKSLKFTLDEEVNIASASENLVKSEKVYGKRSTSVTAFAIGSESNLPQGTEFTIQGVDAEISAARSDEIFTGGTSKEVTVVSRADYDAMVKALTTDLVEKAKTELASGVAGKEKLIDATIKSVVSGKTFQEELDQEAQELHGKITVRVTGISYNEEDIAQIFKDLVSAEVPTGYALVPAQTTMKVSNVTVKKDGSISLSAVMRGAALPTLVSQDIAKALSGKSIKKAEEYLRSVTGVSGMIVGFRWVPVQSRLPLNKNNISVSISLQE